MVIFFKKEVFLASFSKDKVKQKLKFRNEVWFNLSKILPVWLKLVSLSIERRIVELALDMVSLLKLKQIEEDLLEVQWKIITLKTQAGNFSKASVIL